MSLPPKSNDPIVSLPLRQTAQTSRSVYSKLVGTAFVLDLLVIGMALVFAHWLRFQTMISQVGVVDLERLGIRDYLGHFFLGAALMVSDSGELSPILPSVSAVLSFYFEGDRQGLFDLVARIPQYHIGFESRSSHFQGLFRIGDGYNVFKSVDQSGFGLDCC